MGHGEYSIRVDRGDEADRAAIAALHTAAFGRPAEAGLVDALRAGDTWIPELSLVAEDGSGEVVGHVVFTRVRAGGHGFVVLSPLAVLPSLQRTGAGSALVRDGLARCDAAGHPLVVVEGDPRYYGRFGFRPAEELGLTPPGGWPAFAFQAIPLAGYDPAIRGEVEHPAPFFELD